MTSKTLNVPPFGSFCIDSLTTNPDGSYTTVNARQGACNATPPPDASILLRGTVERKAGGTWRSYPNVDMTTFEGVFGSPYPNGAAPVRFAIPAGKIVAMRLPIPANLAGRMFGGDTYSQEYTGPIMKAIFCLSKLRGGFDRERPYLAAEPQQTDRGFILYRATNGNDFYAAVGAEASDWYLNIHSSVPGAIAKVSFRH